MEWKKSYLDVILVPLGFMICMGYHVWLWHKVRTQPLSTIIGTNARGRRFWVTAIMKVYIYIFPFFFHLLFFKSLHNVNVIILELMSRLIEIWVRGFSLKYFVKWGEYLIFIKYIFKCHDN